jgi:signal transduction histidine kinase
VDPLDARLRRLNRLAVLGELLADVVHEVRNPLVSVKTFLELLPERRDDPEFTNEFREVVRAEVERLERLLDEVLHHAAPEPAIERPRGRRTQPIECVASTVRLLQHRAAEKGIQLERHFAASLPEVAMHADALRQVLLNLALNAIQVTPRGGRVSVSVLSRGRSVEIRVDDEGPGIPPEDRAAIFERFVTSRAGGRGGLGLAIARRLTREARGSLVAESAPGGGARFRLELPVAPAAAAAAAKS